MAPGPSDLRYRAVLLVGFMAAGKTAVGELLAARLGWTFRDVDREVESRADATVAEIFRERGEAWFREEEARVTRRLLEEDGVVVATGGGWAAAAGRLESVAEGVLTVWLRVGPEEAVRRAAASPGTRPLLEPAEGAVDRARALLRTRMPRYGRAALHLDTEDASPADLSDRILTHLRGDTPPAHGETS